MSDWASSTARGGPDGLPARLEAGSVIAGYELLSPLGQGGMAVVWLARDTQLDRQVALKILALALTADELYRKRFITESRAASAIDDPHIIPVYQAGEADGVLYIAMRYARGGDVGTLCRREGPLPPARVAAILSPIASALDAAHEEGLVHRDVKPANMLIDARPRRPDHVYLADFGLSLRSVSSQRLTMAGFVMGTPDYCAPEQINGNRALTGQTDQYALACSTLEMLTGAPPFPREDSQAILYAHLLEPPPRLSMLRPGMPPGADGVLARAMAKTPQERYPTCQDFADELRSALGLPPYLPDVTGPPSFDGTPFDGHPAVGPDGGGGPVPRGRHRAPALSQVQTELATAPMPADDDPDHHPDHTSPADPAAADPAAADPAAAGPTAGADPDARSAGPGADPSASPDEPGADPSASPGRAGSADLAGVRDLADARAQAARPGGSEAVRPTAADAAIPGDNGAAGAAPADPGPGVTRVDQPGPRPAPPPPPARLSTRIKSDAVVLRWAPPSAGAPVAYKVVRLTTAPDGSQPDFRVLGTTSSTEFEDAGVPGGVLVTHEVIAISNRQASPAARTAPALMCRDVANLRADAGDDGITLHWWLPLRFGRVVIEREGDPTAKPKLVPRRAIAEGSTWTDARPVPGRSLTYHVFAEYRDAQGAAVRTRGATLRASAPPDPAG